MVENKVALTDCRTTHAELKILCPDCGTTNTITINHSTSNYTLYCKGCGAELRLFLRRPRPASFAPPSAISSARTDVSSKHFPKSGEKSVAVEMESLYQVYVYAFSVSKDSLKEGGVF
jgi:ribosomal protein S27E